MFVEHFKKYAEYVQSDFKLSPSAFVFEIGSNDGTLLSFFKKSGCSVLGVDPALKIAEDATARGIPTLPRFFSSSLVDEVLTNHPQPKVIIANNVFAHIDDLDEVARGVCKLLDPNEGIFVIEFSYLADVIEKNLFDTIYHEHLCYHSLKPLRQFFQKHGMEVIDTLRVPSHGGSLRVVAQVKGARRPVSDRVESLIAFEKTAGLYEFSTFQNFGKSIERIGIELKGILTQLKSQGKSIAGFGAPAKATTLMYQFGIGPEIVDFIIDDSPLKQGLFTPGFHIPVLSSNAIRERKPDYLVLLAWNFADSIIAKNSDYLAQGGHFIVPLPRVQVV